MAKLSANVGDQDHVQGAPDAPITLVEYGDYECPTCGDAYPIVKKVQKHFGKQLRFVHRNFPLPQHDFAEPAAETAEFAAKHDKFWEMHDALYENQSRMDDDLFIELTEKLGLNPDELNKALLKGTYEPKVEDDLASGEASGVHGTPTFYINGEQHTGSFAFEALVKAIEAKAK